MKKFEIDINYCTSITKHREIELCKTEDEKVIYMLNYGTTKGSSTWSEDHPEFTKLREQLGEEGYIYIQRGWWNGDRVLKLFQLNNKTFKKGDQFSSGAAIRHTLEH